MKEASRAALLAELVRELRKNESWAGETHVQKTTYFLQELFGVPFDFKFTLYKFGPFSFDLRDQLNEMRNLDQLEFESQPKPYGPKLKVGDGSDQLRTRFPKTIKRYKEPVKFVSKELGPYGVAKLERVATALLVTKEMPDASVEERSARLNKYKPHVSLELSKEAIETVDGLTEEAATL